MILASFTITNIHIVVLRGKWKWQLKYLIEDKWLWIRMGWLVFSIFNNI